MSLRAACAAYCVLLLRCSCYLLLASCFSSSLLLVLAAAELPLTVASTEHGDGHGLICGVCVCVLRVWPAGPLSSTASPVFN